MPSASSAPTASRSSVISASPKETKFTAKMTSSSKYATIFNINTSCFSQCYFCQKTSEVCLPINIFFS